MISFLKVIGILLSGIFGIVGQVKDFRDKQTGKVTVWGRRNLVGLILSALNKNLENYAYYAAF